MPEALETVHELECFLGRDLLDSEYAELLDYLENEPMDDTPEYLVQLFELH